MSLWKQNKLTLNSRPSTTPHTCWWMDTAVKGPPLYCNIALDKAVLWFDACSSGVSLWQAPNDSWLSLLLLEELATILCSQRAIDACSRYMSSYSKFLILQIKNMYVTNQLILFNFYQIFWIMQFHRKFLFSTW
jgi:hypothetical protein